MDCEQDVSTAFVDREKQQKTQEAPFDEQRHYNREYMRRRRADPSHQARERGKRRQSYYDRKLREAEQQPGPYANDRGEPVCGFCRLRPPLQTVLRLQISDSAPGGYVKIRIPYCGQC
jgi:hypothetical protein